MPKAIPITPREVAMFGHIAVALRAALEKRKWQAPDLNHALGLERGNSQGYKWIAGKAAPGPKYRAKVAKLTGLVETDLIPRKVAENGQALVVLPTKPSVVPARTGDVLSFVVSGTGDVRIKLDVVLPLATGTPLLRMLLDAGIVFTGVDA